MHLYYIQGQGLGEFSSAWLFSHAVAVKKSRLSATRFVASVMGSVNVYPWGV